MFSLSGALLPPHIVCQVLCSIFLSVSQFKIFGGGGCYLGEGVIDTKISGFTTQQKTLKMIRRGKKRYNPKIGKLVWYFGTVLLLGLLFVIFWRCLNGRRWW